MKRRISRRAVLSACGILQQGWRLSSAMSSKLDPALAAMLEDPQAEAEREVTVLVGLAHPASDATLADLRARGLTVRSVIGDVLTGAAPLGRMEAIAAQPEVVKIEAGTPLAPEAAPPSG